MRTFLRQLKPALLVALVFTVICGVVYPNIWSCLSDRTEVSVARSSSHVPICPASRARLIRRSPSARWMMWFSRLRFVC